MSAQLREIPWRNTIKTIAAFIISLLMTVPVLADLKKPTHVVRFNDHQTGSEEEVRPGRQNHPD